MSDAQNDPKLTGSYNPSLGITEGLLENMPAVPGKRLRYLDSSSGYHGVCWHIMKEKWLVKIKIKGKNLHIGHFEDEMEAAHAWDSYLKEHNITDHPLNFSSEKA